MHDLGRGAHMRVTADLGRSTPFEGGRRSLDNLKFAVRDERGDGGHHLVSR